MSLKSREIKYKGENVVLEIGTPLFVLEAQASDGYELTKIDIIGEKQVKAPCVYDDWGNAHWELKDTDFGKKVFLSEKDVREFMYSEKRPAEKIGYHSQNIYDLAYEISNKSIEIEYNKEAESNKKCILTNIAEIRTELDRIEELLPAVKSFDMRTKKEKREGKQI